VIVDRPDWAFSGDLGPDRWAEIDPAYAKCATGRRQSPVDLAAAVEGPPADLALDYQPGPLTFIDIHWTLQIKPESGSRMMYEGSPYELVEAHFHTPAEHPIGGGRADLESHFVHMGKDGSLAVVAVLWDAAPGEHPIDSLVTAIPDVEGGTTVSHGAHDLEPLIPFGSRTYRYDGSRTTPPCDENVSWIVMERRGSVGTRAVEAFMARYGEDSRPIQALNGRRITLG
jgi:carbonic anhydrase